MGTMSAEQIYDNFRQSPGTGMWQAAQAAADHMAQDMPELAADIKRLQDTMRAAWQGTAADEANQGAEPLALGYIATADNLQTAQDLVGRQTESFALAANSVRPVPPVPSTVDATGPMFGEPNMQQQVSQYLDAAQHNVDVYSAYHGASQYNTSNLPMDYDHLAADNATITMTAPPVMGPAGAASSTRMSAVRSSRSTQPTSDEVPSARHRVDIASAPTQRSSGVPAAAIAANKVGVPDTSTTTTSGYRPPTPVPGIHAAVPSSHVPGTHTLVPGTHTPGSSPTDDSAGLPDTMPTPVDHLVTASGMYPSTRPSAVNGAADQQEGSFAAARGGDVSGGELPGSGAGPVVMRGPVDDGGPLGAGSRSAIGAILDPAGTGRQAASASSAVTDEPEEAPMGMPGARRGEDEEHRTSRYLHQPNANELFGAAERAVVPVIGE